MNLTVKEARYLVQGLEELNKNIELLSEIYAPYSKKEEVAEVITKQSEGLTKLYTELSNYIYEWEYKAQLEFNFKDYL
jgi:UDP-glucose 6-dehydrogenase